MSAAPVAVAGLSLSGLTDVATRLGYALPLVGLGAESAGLPVPGETTLLVSAVLAGDGRLTPWGVALAGFVGAVLGDNLGYWAGRRFGMRLARLPVLRRLYTPDRLAAAQRLSAGRGAFAAVFLARFAVMLRVLGGPLAGMHQMPWPRFLVANAAGAAVWTGLIVTVGLLIGDNLHRAHALLTWVGLAGLAVATFFLATTVVLARRRRRSHRGEHSSGAGPKTRSWLPRQESLTVPAGVSAWRPERQPDSHCAGWLPHPVDRRYSPAPRPRPLRSGLGPVSIVPPSGLRVPHTRVVCADCQGEAMSSGCASPRSVRNEESQ